MCGRSLWCSFLFLLCCCCLVLPAGASDVPEGELQVDVDSAAVLEDDAGIDPQAGGRYYYGYIGMNPDDGVIMVTNGPNAGSTLLASLDLGEFMSEQGYLTAANLTNVETYLSNIYVRLGNMYVSLGNIYTVLGTVNTRLEFIYNRLDVLNSIKNYLSGDSSGPLTSIRDYLSGSSFGPLSSIQNYLSGSFSGPLTVIRDNLSASSVWSYDSETNTLTEGDSKSYTISELVDLRSKGMSELLLKNFGQSPSFLYLPYSGIGTQTSFPANQGLMPVLAAIGETLYNELSWLGPGFLDRDGTLNAGQYRQVVPLSYWLGWGLIGLNTNLETALVGGHGGSASYSRLTFDEKLNKKTAAVGYTDLLHAMVGIGTDIQNPVSQLQAVLAGDDDLKLRQNVQDNVGSVTDNFTGDGGGSVSTDNISDAAGLTAGVGDAFGGNQVSTGDIFSTANDSDNWNFFSEESAMSMDAVTYPAAEVLSVDDDYLDGFVADEYGFYSVADKSGWSFLDYLGKEE